MQKYCKNQNNINILLDHESGRGFKVTFTINEEGESNILVITRAPKSHNAEDLKKELNKAGLIGQAFDKELVTDEIISKFF